MNESTMNRTDRDPRGTASVAAVLRIGLGVVFLSFGLWKASSPFQWVVFLPNWVSGMVANVESLDALGVLRLMGFLETVLGLQLLIGLFTKATATMCTFLLLGIIFQVGLDQIGIRDVGLLSASVALILCGGGRWSADHWMGSDVAMEN